MTVPLVSMEPLARMASTGTVVCVFSAMKAKIVRSLWIGVPTSHAQVRVTLAFVLILMAVTLVSVKMATNLLAIRVSK